jgi:gp6-like head-tail connector protein
MAWVSVKGQPEAEIVSLGAMKKFLRIPSDSTDDDNLIQSLIVAARVHAETYTGKSLAKKAYTQYLDGFPYFANAAMDSSAYPPDYYALPRQSTTLWNYSQMIKLYYPPLVAVDKIEYVGADGGLYELQSGSGFQVDFATEPARLFPPAGQMWPPTATCANAVGIYFTAGYEVQSTEEPADDAINPTVAEPETLEVGDVPTAGQRTTYVVDRTIPETIVIAIKQLVVHWYQNRDPVIAGAGSAGKFVALPFHVEALLDSERCIDFSPTRG